MSGEPLIVSSVVAFPTPPTDAKRPDVTAGGNGEPRATDYRLVIETGPRAGTYIYKTVDLATGEIIRQFPREDLVKLIDDPRYATGSITSTRA